MNTNNIQQEEFFQEVLETVFSQRHGEKFFDRYPEMGYMSTTQAMDTLGISLPTLHRYRQLHNLPYIKVGRRVYYGVLDIHMLLAGVVDWNEIFYNEGYDN